MENAGKHSDTVFERRLKSCGMHIDFLRLRCGAEKRFHQAVSKIPRAHPFMAFSEWDAVVILPSEELYPEMLNTVYATGAVASSVAGSSGYFAYLWEHPINERFEANLREFSHGGVTILMALRFDDRVRHAIGLGAELVFCDYLSTLLRRKPFRDVRAIVSHSLGWNDVVVLLHTPRDEGRLTKLVSKIRLLSVANCLDRELAQRINASYLFAASYTHLLGGYRRFIEGSSSLGTLAKKVVNARLLVRVAAPLEAATRQHISKLLRQRGTRLAQRMPSEMGHYSFSVDLTRLIRKNEGTAAVRVIMDARRWIGEQTGESLSSYCETSTLLQFDEPPQQGPTGTKKDQATHLEADLKLVRELIESLPKTLRNRGVTQMTAYRFASALTTIYDHLSDPVRSSVVRHLPAFLHTLRKRLVTLDRDDIDDLCQILEYAVYQAVDGVMQFQHDANSLGLSGRGGYSRLITTVRMYTIDIMVRLGIRQAEPLVTFGLRAGYPGSTGTYQIDLPFEVLFVPNRWYILLHEIGHVCWSEQFGWLPESLDRYLELERETPIKENAKIDFIRARSIVREFFPHVVVYILGCGLDLDLFDRLSVRGAFSHSRPSSRLRELLMTVVADALLETVTPILEKATKGTGKASGSEMWTIWNDEKKLDQKRRIGRSVRRVQAALMSLLEGARNHDERTLIMAKQQIVGRDTFALAAEEALLSVMRVFAGSSREFGSKKSDERSLFFERLLRGIGDATAEIAHYRPRAGKPFATWLADGHVMANAPAGHVWTNLLLQSSNEMKKMPERFLISQLACILSIWHRAITSVHLVTDTRKALEDLLFPLDLVYEKPIEPAL